MKHLRLAYAGCIARTINFKNQNIKSLNVTYDWMKGLSMKGFSAKMVHLVTLFAYLTLTFAPTVSFATQSRTITEELVNDDVSTPQTTPQNLRITLQNPDATRDTGDSSLPDIVKPTPILQLRSFRAMGASPWGFGGGGMGSWSQPRGPVSIFDQQDDVLYEPSQPDRTHSPEPNAPPSRTEDYFAPTRMSIETRLENGQFKYQARGNQRLHFDLNLWDRSSPQAISALGLVPITDENKAVGFVHSVRGVGFITVLYGTEGKADQISVVGQTPESNLETLTLSGQAQFLLEDIRINRLVQNTTEVFIGQNAPITTIENLTDPASESYLGLTQEAQFQGHMTGSPYSLIQTEGQFSPQSIANFNQTRLEIMDAGRADLDQNTFGGSIMNMGDVCLRSLESLWTNITNAGRIVINQGRHIVQNLTNQIEEIKGQVSSGNESQLNVTQSSYVGLIQPQALQNRSSRDVAIQNFINYVLESKFDEKFLSFLGLYLSVKHRDIYNKIRAQISDLFPLENILSVDKGVLWMSFPEGKYDRSDDVPLEEVLFELKPEKIMEIIFKSDNEKRVMLRGKIAGVFLDGWPLIMQRLDEFTHKWFPRIDSRNYILNTLEQKDAKVFYDSVKDKIQATLESFFGGGEEPTDQPNIVVGNTTQWGQFESPEVQFVGRQVPEGMEVVGNLNLDATSLGLRSLNQLRSIGVRGLLNVAVREWDERENVVLPGIYALGINGTRVNFHRDITVQGLNIDVTGHAGFGDSNSQMSRLRVALPEGMDSLDPADYRGKLFVRAGDADFRYAQVTVDRDAYVQAVLSNILLGSSTAHGGGWKTRSQDNHELGFICLGGTANDPVTTTCAFYLANGSFFRVGGTTTMDARRAILMEGANLGSRLHMNLRAGQNIQAQFSNIQGMAGGEMTAPRVALERHAGLHRTGIRLSSKYKNCTVDLIRSEGTHVQFMDDLRVNSQAFRLLASHIQTGGSFVHNGEARQEGQMGASVEPMKYGAADRSTYLRSSIRSGQEVRFQNGPLNVNGDLSGQLFRAEVQTAAFRNSSKRQILRDRNPETLSISEIMRMNPSSIGVRNLQRDGDGNYINPLPGSRGFHPNLRQCLVFSPNFDYITNRPSNSMQHLDMEAIVLSIWVEKTGRGYIKKADGTSVSGAELLAHFMHEGRLFEKEFFKNNHRYPLETEIHGHLNSMIYFVIGADNELLLKLYISPDDKDKYSQGAGEFQDSHVETQGDFLQENFALIGHERILNRVGGSQHLLSQAIREYQYNGFDDRLYARAIQEGGRILNQVAGHQIREGAILHGQESVRNEAGQGIHDLVVRLLSHHVSGSKKKRTIEDKNRPEGGQLICDHGRVQDIAHQGNIVHEATTVRGQGIDIAAPEGQYERRAAILYNEIHVRIHKKNVLRTKMGGHGSMSQTVMQSHLDPGEGGLNIFAQNVYAELRPDEMEECFREALKGYPDAEIKILQDAYQDYRLKTQRSLSPYVVSLIAIGIAIATQGMGLGQALANKLFSEVAAQVAAQAATQGATQVATQITAQTIAHAAVTGAVNAAITNVLTQFTVGTIQNKGRIGHTLKDVFSKEGLKSIGQSAATAAFAAALIRGFDLKVPQSLGKGETMSYMDRLKLASVNFTSSSTMGMAFGGHPQDVLLSNLRAGAADFIQAILAEKVGQFFKEEDAGKASTARGSSQSQSGAPNPSAPGTSGGTANPSQAPEFSFIDQLSRYMVHSGIGAMVGQISSSESLSRATGAVVGEFVGDVYRQVFSDPWDFDPENPKRQENIERALVYVEVASIGVAAAFGLDVNEMKTSATIAARENAFADFIRKNRDPSLDADARETEIGKFHEEIEEAADQIIQNIGGWIGLDGQTEVDENAPHFMQIYDSGHEAYAKACMEREEQNLGRDLTVLERESVRCFAQFKFNQIATIVSARMQADFNKQMFTFFAPYIEDVLSPVLNVFETTVNALKPEVNPAETRANRMVFEAVLDRLMILTGIGGVAKSATKQVSKSAVKSVARSAERSGVRNAGSSAARTMRSRTSDLIDGLESLTHRERQQMLEAFPHGLNRPVPSSSPRVDMSQFSGQMTPSGEISVRFVGATPNPVPQNIRALEIQRMEYIMTQQLSEPGTLIAGRGTHRLVDDAPRLVAQHGGNIEDWVKMTSNHRTLDSGVNIQTHYYKNLRTDQKVDAKFTLNKQK